MIQPTHGNSPVAGLPSDAPGAPYFWRQRVFEMAAIIDRLDEVEQQAPALAGRLDHRRIAAAGHSFGGHTVSLLLVAQLAGESFADLRISAGVLLATPGRAGRDLTEQSAARFPFFDVDFAHTTTPSLVVCGADDNPHFTSRGPEWHADAFHDGPGPRLLLTCMALVTDWAALPVWMQRKPRLKHPTLWRLRGGSASPGFAPLLQLMWMLGHLLSLHSTALPV